MRRMRNVVYRAIGKAQSLTSAPPSVGSEHGEYTHEAALASTPFVLADGL